MIQPHSIYNTFLMSTLFTWTIPNVMTKKSGLNHCNLTAMVLLSKDNFDIRTFLLVTSAVVIKRSCCTDILTVITVQSQTVYHIQDVLVVLSKDKLVQRTLFLGINIVVTSSKHCRWSQKGVCWRLRSLQVSL